ncbi:MAG TPA: amidohydrolase family protein [Allosphingosinicella sp.]|nr:amidohydrolase family protein [Allosphingosinicella sp.]
MRLGLLLLGLALAAGASGAAAETSCVRAGRLVDVEKGRILADRLVTVSDGRVVAVQPWAAAACTGPLTDWSRYTVLPGLIDMHTHLADYGQTANPAEPLLHSAAETAYVAAANARVTLAAGFTTVRDVGTYRAFADVALRDAIEAGHVPGPRMKVVGAYITVPGGGGEVTGLAPDVVVPAEFRAGVVTSPEEVRTKARTLFQRGADFLKLIATGAVLTEGTEPGALELSDAEIRAAVAEAERNGSYATAHAHGAEGIKSALRAGVRSIEHASLIDEEGIALAKAKGAWLAMDVYNGDYIEEVGTRDGWSANILRKNRETTDAQREGFRKAVRAGARIVFATDAGVYPHGGNARQFAYMVRHGMTPMQAIQSATIEPARLMRWDEVGAIAPGRFADMVAVEGDPLADIRVLERPAAVMKGGALVR